MNHPPRTRTLLTAVLGIAVLLATSPALAQTGVDDDRVSLPEGPGSLEGVGDNVEIDPNMGAMRTSVAITLPSGFGSLTPNLSLSYSSSAGSGPVGIGWSIPERTIERMTSRRVPLYDTQDFFAADGGNELVQVGADGSDLVYRARFEKDFSRYTWVSPGPGEDGYWKVQFADGTVGYFGATQDGELVDTARSTHPDGGTYRYLLVDHVDPFGHTIHYEYDAFGGNRPLLVGVSWVDDGSGTPLYSAELAYEERPDLISDAGAGYEELLAHRLTTLTVRDGSETIREYVLTYENEDDAGGYSRLQRVEQYGLGGRRSGELYPVVFTYEYQKALGVECTASDCPDSPYIVDMGTVAGGAGLASGKATLIDINGDGLADVLDTSQGSHQFYLNRLTPNSGAGFDHAWAGTVASAVNTSLVLTNASDTVQVLDLNGDGFSDLVDTVSGSFLINDPDAPDWLPTTSQTDVSAISTLDFSTARFFDYDNDKRIDVILSTPTNTQVFANQEGRFSALTTDPIGVSLTATGVQLADFNGDGLNDVVEIGSGGTVRFRLNLGRGVWAEWVSLSSVTITETERALVDLEDLNGDGVSDLVIVGQGEVKYAINRNAQSFDAWVTIRSMQVDGTIPDRTNKTVLFADMNANGSEDIVWFDASGGVQYLELFPMRPNLLSRIDNGLGFVQKITYGTSAEHAARADAAGEPWETRLPHPNAVVDRVDSFVTLTGSDDGSGLHEVTTYTYRNGWYDGLEKQFRGFSDVTLELEEGEGQEGGRTVSRYHLGNDGAPHRNGLLLSQVIESGGEVLSEVDNEYTDCVLDGVPTPAQLEAQGKKGVYFPCMTAVETLIKERLTDEAEWITLRTENQYDGYGQIALVGNLGDLSVSGDEDYVRTTRYEPTAAFWHTDLVVREERSAAPDFPASDTNLTINYYDGTDFVGLAEGEATHGFLTRTEQAVAPGEFVQTLRQRRDEHGNSIETIDPNGTLDGSDHRRTYTYDETGLFLTTTDLHLGDYALRRESRYETTFQRLIELTRWMVVEGGEIATARNSSTFRYDDFGRLVERYEPGDTGTPSQRFTYDLGEPFSRLVIEDRSQADSSTFDERSIRCFDGRGRKYQDRVRTKAGEYQVSGFTSYNRNGKEVEVFQPFTSDSEDCSAEPPANVRSVRLTYDAAGRLLERSLPGEEIYGERLLERTVYRPLVTEQWDPEDNASGPHAGTPMRTLMDGLQRPVAFERELAGGTLGRTTLHYDATNSFAGYTDHEGNRHELTVDLAERVTASSDPNTGTTTFVYDDAGNVIASTDARGVTVETVYDGQNRVVERFDPANRESTLVTWHYDTLPDGCELTECTNTAGQLAAVSYPVDLGNGRIEQGMDRFGYDQRQRAVLSARRLGLLADLVTARTFDNRNRVASLTHPDGTVVAIDYDPSGRIEAMSGFASAIAYDERGDWTRVDYANGARLERTRDALQREATRHITDGTGAVVLDHALTRNMANMVTAVDDTLEGGRDTMRAELDAWYRPTSVTLGNEQLTFGFDLLDRITGIASDAPSSAMNHGALGYSSEQPLALTSAGELALRYDAAGMMIERGELAFERDELGRLVDVLRGGESSGRMVYAAEDRVVQMADADGALVLYGFEDFEVRDGIGRTYARLDGEYLGRKESRALAARVYPDADGDGEITAGDAFVARMQGDEALPTVYVLGAAAARLLVEQETDVVALHTDHLGNVVGASDVGGELRGRRGFYPFGLVRYTEGHVDEHGFTGQEHDVATGLVHMKFRELDPATGRWDRFDPLFVRLDAAAVTGKPGEATTGYAYVSNQPFDHIDPMGLDKEKKAKLRQIKQLKKQKKKAQKEKGAVRKELDQANANYKAARDQVKEAKAAIQNDINASKDSALGAQANYDLTGDERSHAKVKTEIHAQEKLTVQLKQLDKLLQTATQAIVAKQRELDRASETIDAIDNSINRLQNEIDNGGGMVHLE